MLNTDGVVEELIESWVFNFLLILHFDLKYFPLIHVCVADHVLRQINRRDWIVNLKDLGQNKQVFTVEALLAKVQLDELIETDFSHWDLTDMHTDSLNIMLIDELCQVL